MKSKDYKNDHKSEAHEAPDTNRRNLLKMGGLAFLGLTGVAATAEEEGMFVHLHYFKFKPEVPGEEIAVLMKELAGLKEKIPVLKEFLVGKNTSKSNKGFHYAQVSIFEKEEDLQVYSKHPEHRKLVRQIGPKMEDGISMDFEPL